jgi:hypothetical protein
MTGGVGGGEAQRDTGCAQVMYPNDDDNNRGREEGEKVVGWKGCVCARACVVGQAVARKQAEAWGREDGTDGQTGEGGKGKERKTRKKAGPKGEGRWMGAIGLCVVVVCECVPMSDKT